MAISTISLGRFGLSIIAGSENREILGEKAAIGNEPPVESYPVQVAVLREIHLKMVLILFFILVQFSNLDMSAP